MTPKAGRRSSTKVSGFRIIDDTTRDDAAEPITRYGYRSFDRQWAFDDPRMAKTDSPALWQNSSGRQVYLASLLTLEVGAGPALTASPDVPDLHYFSGRGGKDIIPIWRDAAATEPNLTADLAERLGRALGMAPPSVEEVAAYAYALLSATAYQTRFAEALRTPGLRVPLTADADLWREAVAAGRSRLWLHTYAERFRDPAAGRGAHVPLVAGVEWETAVTRLPRDGDDIDYDADAAILTVADGQLTGVRADVWAYEVSGMPVLRKWLGYRTAKGAGRAASSRNALDRIRPDAWPDAWNDELQDLVRVLTLTLDAEPDLADLLARVCDGPLIEADRLPRPSRESRPAPRHPAPPLAGRRYGRAGGGRGPLTVDSAPPPVPNPPRIGDGRTMSQLDMFGPPPVRAP